MKNKFIAHKQAFWFSILTPISLILLIWVPVLLIFHKDLELWYFIMLAVQLLFSWIVCYGFYNYAYKIICMSEDQIKSGKIEIKWENIQRYEITEIKLFEHSFIPTIALTSKLSIYGTSGEIIVLSMSKKHLETIAVHQDKSDIIRELVSKYLRVSE
ncbi:MAG: hypothetical protein IJ400_04445 [Clostridia bacterium]|nr:hypothetical protein [Clostridia bacterium]